MIGPSQCVANELHVTDTIVSCPHPNSDTESEYEFLLPVKTKGPALQGLSQ